jgi:levansucrase
MLKSNVDASPQAVDAVSLWTAKHIAGLSDWHQSECALITAADAVPIIDGLSLWDVWPVQLDNGNVADVAGGTLWVTLSAPRRDDPDLRHDEARMRLLYHVAGQWRDCGDLFPDGFAPGSREWSGSTRFDPDTGTVTVWFTAAGRRGDTTSGFEQRLFHATGHLDVSGKHPTVTHWRNLTQSAVNDGSLYCDLAVNSGIPGRIKGFRDPYWFRDPADGSGYILFTGSKSVAASRSHYDGVIGIAAEQTEQPMHAGRAEIGTESYTLLPPLLDADGLANELERPHVIVQDGQYYVFWSSQSHIFHPDGPKAPTGLYGMVAPSLFGPYQPLNETGLVLANPAAEPRQCYAWQVIPSDRECLEVISFVDYWGLQGLDPISDPVLKAKHFGGTIAPMVRIELSGATSRILSGPR